MNGQVEPPAAQVVAQPFGQRESEGQLPVWWEMATQKVGAGGRAFGNLPQQWEDAGAQRGEERPQRGHRLAGFEADHQCVIGVRIIADAFGHLAVQRDRLFQMRGESLEIAVRSGSGPDLVAQRAVFGERFDKERGDPGVIGERLAHLRADHAFDGTGREMLDIAFGCVQKPAGCVGKQVIARHDLECRQLPRPCRGTAWRHQSQRIPVQDRLGVEQVVDLTRPRKERGVTH